MGYATKVQKISRSNGPVQWYVNFPTALAEAIDFEKGETVEWHVEDRCFLILHRLEAPPAPIAVKKTAKKTS